tara:strand:- start:5046 stop:5999 length:954 start_codon:yes stop_codon:yes gene_type:complete
MYVCPICKESLKRVFNNYSLKCQNLRCNQFKNQFKILKGIPNLIPFGEEGCILKKDESKDLNYGSSLRRVNKFAKDIRIISSRIFKGKNIISEENINFLISNLEVNNKVLVIGGGNIGYGMNKFYEKCKKHRIEFHSIDVYFSKNITAIADANFLPFPDKIFDIVIVQAVLEHVIDPHKVVKEIFRVIQNEGLVYSETPFIQSVHEGAYDFTRFTHSGHRWLFRDFVEVKSGFNQGAFSSLLFIGSHAISGLFRFKSLGILIRLIFGRLAKLLDYLCDDKSNIDIACGNYFIGKKTKKDIKEKDSSWIIRYYKGAQK